MFSPAVPATTDSTSESINLTADAVDTSVDAVGVPSSAETTAAGGLDTFTDAPTATAGDTILVDDILVDDSVVGVSVVEDIEELDVAPRFADLDLPRPLLRAGADLGFDTPTAIQAA